jgi:hypothetical protein
MKIENRIAAFKAGNFEEAFKGFESFALADLEKLAINLEESADWVECYIEEESSFLYSDPDNMEMDSDAANEIFGNPEKWIILIDNMDSKEDYIGAIGIFLKEDFLNEKISFPLDFSKIPLSIIG